MSISWGSATPADDRTVTEAPAGPGESRVLVVDDNVEIARALSRLLTATGYAVEVVHDGPAALSAARASRPAIVLLDIGLPGMDGYEVASRLRRDVGLTDAVLVVISGYGEDPQSPLSASTGIDHHLVKPVDFPALLAVLPRNGRADEGA